MAPRRLLLGFALSGCTACVCLLVAGCTRDVVTVEPAAGSDDPQCRRLLEQLPEQVDGADARQISPEGAAAAAWGDPPIVVRCGVDRPAALTRSSFCSGVDGVGWLATRDGVELDPSLPVDGSVTFTTIGRSTFVEVTVPEAYQPQADPLIDVAPAITDATDELAPCK